MPNRIIKESIRESYSIDKLTPQSEVLYYRLITYADDYGLFKSDARLLNTALFPLKNYRESQVILWIDEIADTGMIIYYIGNDGKAYGMFKNWSKFQVSRNIKAKYPLPDGMEQFTTIGNQLKSIEINCNQLKADVTVIQSNPNPNPKKKEKPGLIFSDDFKNNEKRLAAIKEWIKYRKEAKKPISQSQLNKQMQWLTKQDDPIECINQSIRNGWQGLFNAREGEFKSKSTDKYAHIKPGNMYLDKMRLEAKKANV